MKKNKKLAQLALLGLTNGLLLNAPGTLSAENQNYTPESISKETILVASCGKSCKAVAASCKNGCKAIASSCKNGCKAIANRDLPQNQKLQDPSKVSDKIREEANDENLGYHLMTEKELLLELNDAGIKQYQSLSPEGKALAREVASQRCGRTNKCKGLNACETEKNSCAGKGSCANTTKCSFADKNLAVKVVADKMAQKRTESLQKQ
ncbi:MAG: hypothetical protein ACXWM7_00045 [Parachlamydiaceae bacterium]